MCMSFTVERHLGRHGVGGGLGLLLLGLAAPLDLRAEVLHLFREQRLLRVGLRGLTVLSKRVDSIRKRVDSISKRVDCLK